MPESLNQTLSYVVKDINMYLNTTYTNRIAKITTNSYTYIGKITNCDASYCYQADNQYLSIYIYISINDKTFCINQCISYYPWSNSLSIFNTIAEELKLAIDKSVQLVDNNKLGRLLYG